MRGPSGRTGEAPQETAPLEPDRAAPEGGPQAAADADLDYSTADEGGSAGSGSAADASSGKRARIFSLPNAAVEQATSRGRAFAQSVTQAVRRVASPARTAFLLEEQTSQLSSAREQEPAQDEGAEALAEAEQLAALREEVEQLKMDRDHQSEQRKVLQTSLARERSRNESLAGQNEELQKAAEERLQGLQRVSDVETDELTAQVKALLLIKRQLYDRMQEVEAERNTLLFEREDGSGRTCKICLDHLANTVLLRCRHLVCCDGCAKRLTHCPVCRQRVNDRMAVFMS